MNHLVRYLTALLAVVVGASASAQDADQRDWDAAKSANSREAYEDYLTAHPAGRFTRDALLAIVRKAGEPTIETEESGGLILPAQGPGVGTIPALY